MSFDNEYSTIGEFGQVIMGLSPKGDTYNENGEGLPLLNGPTEFGSSHPLPTLYTTDSKRESKKGDLIFCVRASTGRMNWSDQIYSLGRGVCAIRGKSNVDTKYLRYALEVELDSLLNVAGGGTFPNLKKDDIKKFKIPVLKNKDELVRIISAYDDLIQNNIKRIALLEQAGKNIYKEWFVHMRFPGFEGKSIDRDTGRLNGWRMLRFDEVFEVQNGYAFKSKDYSDSGIQVLRTKDYSSSFFIKNTEHQFLPTDFEKLYRKYLVKELDLMLIMVGASIGRLGLVLDKDIPLLQNQNQWAIRAKREFSSYEHYKIFYVQSIVKSLLMKRTGAARDFFRASFLKEMEILLPPEKLIKEFTDIVSPLFSQINVLLKLNKEYSTARNILLPRLMNQTIKV